MAVFGSLRMRSELSTSAQGLLQAVQFVRIEVIDARDADQLSRTRNPKGECLMMAAVSSSMGSRWGKSSMLTPYWGKGSDPKSSPRQPGLERAAANFLAIGFNEPPQLGASNSATVTFDDDSSSI